MKQALVTGHAGFVGRHMVRALHERGYAVTGIDISPDTPDSSHDPRGYLTSYQGDCREFFKDEDRSYDLVVHLAAIVGGRLTIDNEPLKVATDLSIDAEMFNWAVKTGQKRIVYYSSSAAYPVELQTREMYSDLSETDISLDLISKPDMTYGWAKLTGEMLSGFAREQGINVHVFRPFSGYGADQALEYPFPSFIERASASGTEFEIWGDGEQTRDFIHIDDVVDGTLAVVDADYQEPVNLGTGVPTTFNHLADVCMSLQGGRRKEIAHKLDKPVGVHYRVADTERMNQFYTAQISLEEGVWRALNGIV